MFSLEEMLRVTLLIFIIGIFNSTLLLAGEEGGRTYSERDHEIVNSSRIEENYIEGYLEIPGRNIRVVLPPGYDINKEYPVLYLQDGLNSLDWDPFGHGGWQVHKSSEELIKSNEIEPIIIVLIDNLSGGKGEDRVYEYSPVKTNYFTSLFYGTKGGGGDDYINFIIERVIPLVEVKYSASRDRKDRAIGGSSFGGLISLYGGWEYSETFGKVIAMSPYFNWDSKWILDYLKEDSQKRDLAIYLDSGDKSVIPFFRDDGKKITLKVKERLVEIGFQEGKDIRYYYGEGHEHSEKYWRERFHKPLKFLFPVD